MSLAIPIGIDSSETWQVDYCLALARYHLKQRRAELERLENPRPLFRRDGESAEDLAKREQLGAEFRAAAIPEVKKAIAQLEADLAAYVPGSGPIFTVGHIPGALRPKLTGRREGLLETAADAEKMRVGQFEWDREVVRWGVRGHENLRGRGGRALPFSAETEALDGEPFPVVSRETLKAYGTIMNALAAIVIEEQKLSDDSKNA